MLDILGYWRNSAFCTDTPTAVGHSIFSFGEFDENLVKIEKGQTALVQLQTGFVVHFQFEPVQDLCHADLDFGDGETLTDAGSIPTSERPPSERKNLVNLLFQKSL